MASKKNSAGEKASTIGSSTGIITAKTMAPMMPPTTSTIFSFSGTVNLSNIDTAIQNVSSARSTFGAVQNRLEHTINNLGTLPEWRGCGVASTLIASSLRAFAAEGLTHASIGVDSENPSGAARLYRALGFEPVRRTMTHQLEIRRSR